MSLYLSQFSHGAAGIAVLDLDVPPRKNRCRRAAIKQACYSHDVLCFFRERAATGRLLAFSRNFGTVDAPPNQVQAVNRSGFSRGLRRYTDITYAQQSPDASMPYAGSRA